MTSSDVNPYAPPQTPPEPAPPAVLGSPVVLSGELGLDVHLRAYDLLWRKAGFGWQLSITVVLLPVMAVLLGVLAVLQANYSFGTFACLGAMLGAPLLFAICFIGLRRGGRWTLKRAFAKGEIESIRATWTISDDGIHAVSDAIDSKEKWANYESCKASDDMILLYAQSGAAYIPLAREFCSSQHDWDRLREFLRAKLPEKTD